MELPSSSGNDKQRERERLIFIDVLIDQSLLITATNNSNYPETN